MMAGLGLTAAGSVLAACAPAAPPPAPTAAPKPAAAPTTGAAAPAAAPTAAPAKPAAAGAKVLVWQTKLFTQAANDLSKKHIEEFAATKGWATDINDLPTDAMAKMMAGIESGDLPDIVQGSGEVPQLYGTGALVDVTAVVQELIKDNGDVYKLNIRGGNFKGKWWAVPWFMYADAYFCRKDVMDAGNKKIEDFKTFDQRRQLALDLSDPTKQLWGWGITPKDATGDGDILARHVINSWGGSITDESGEKVTLDSPATVAAVAWIQETYQDPKFKKMLPDGVLGWTGSSNNENYLGGKIIFTQNASSLYWAMNNQKNDYYKKTQLVQFPTGPKNELMGGYPYYHWTFTKSKQRDAAIEIAKMQVDKKRQVERTKIAEGQSWPVYQKLNEDPDIVAYIKSDPGYETLFKNCTHQSGWSVGWPAQLNPALATVENQTTLTKLIDDAANNKGKPEQLVKDYHKRCVDIFNQMGLKQ